MNNNLIKSLNKKIWIKIHEKNNLNYYSRLDCTNLPIKPPNIPKIIYIGIVKTVNIKKLLIIPIIIP